jgi:hypothetical protein
MSKAPVYPALVSCPILAMFRALLISIPYAVNVPDEVKVWIV